MNNDKQLKAKIQSLAKTLNKQDRNATAILYRDYFLGRMIEQIMKSEYQNRFTMKGGLLVQSMTNVQMRTTEDVDFHLDNIKVDPTELKRVFEKIFIKATSDGISFKDSHFDAITKNFEYVGVRMKGNAYFGKMIIPVQADMTTGNPIDGQIINYSYPLSLDDRRIKIHAYSTAQIVGEKLQTLIVKGTINSRSKDLYDLWLLNSEKLPEQLDLNAVHNTFMATSKYYQSPTNEKDITEAMFAIAVSTQMRFYWDRYKKGGGRLFIGDLTFEDTVKSVVSLLSDSRLIGKPDCKAINEKLRQFKQQM